MNADLHLDLDRESTVPLTEQLASAVRSKIVSGDFPPGSRLPTLEELTGSLGVGQGTVRRALDLLAREGVIEKRRKLGTFVSETVGSGLDAAFSATPVEKAKLRALRVAIIADTNAIAAIADAKRLASLNSSFEAVISQAGGRCSLVAWKPGDDMAEFFARTGQANAYLYHHSDDHGNQLARTLIETGRPLVVCDYFAKGALRTNVVAEDWVWGMQELMSHLLELGHRRIALAGYYRYGHDEPWIWAEERRRIFLDIARAERLPVSDEDVYWDDQFRHREEEDPGIIAAGHRAGERIFSSGKPYTAIIGINDCIALGVLQAARERGIAVPEQLSVAGFDNHVRAQTGGLTTLKPANEQDGRTAAEMLFEQVLHHRPDTALTAVNKPILIQRNTTAAAYSGETRLRDLEQRRS